MNTLLCEKCPFVLGWSYRAGFERLNLSGSRKQWKADHELGTPAKVLCGREECQDRSAQTEAGRELSALHCVSPCLSLITCFITRVKVADHVWKLWHVM